MKSKTWKIGEYCIGGILRIRRGDKTVNVSALNWHTKAVVKDGVFDLFDLYAIESFLNELTSSYHASKAMDWLKKG